ncbi:MAG: cation:proton antiporter domain-containing protein [Acidimicrobiales bacterium]
MHLPSLSEHQLLVFWTQLLVLLAAARLGGAALRRMGQPAVVGQLLAGVVVGPSVLGKLWPGAEHFVVPGSTAAAAPLNAVSWMGVGLLLVLAGFDTDVALVRRLGRPASAVATGGLLVPFATGIGVALVLPHSFAGGHATRVAFVVFIALALSISSLPVIAKILDELGFMRRDFGQVTVAVGMVNDLLGWLALGIAAAIAGGGARAAALAFPVVAIAVVILLAATVGQRAVDTMLRRSRRPGSREADAVAGVVLVALAMAVLLQAVRSDAVLGTYLAGIMVGRSRFFQRGTRQHIESVTMGVFAPVFFATAGLRIDLAGLGAHDGLAWAAVILVAAIASKTIGAFAGARVAGLASREGLALAIGLNCRGAVEIVIATVGLSLGVLSGPAYTAVVLMAIVTSVMAPPLLRAAARDWQGSPEEQQRLEQEQVAASNLLVRPGRLLVAADLGRASLDAARLAHRVWPVDVPATALLLGDDAPDPAELAAVMGERDLEIRRVRGGVEAVLEESRLGFNVVVLGSRAVAGAGPLVSPLADAVLVQSHLPVVIVRQAVSGERVPQRFRRVLLPVAGGPASRTAEEIAYHLARTMDTGVVLTHVSRPGTATRTLASASAVPNGSRATAATGVVRQALAHAHERDVVARTSLPQGHSPGETIVAEVRRERADLVVVGTTIRCVEGRPFLGHTVEHVLHEVEEAVVVVATPEAVFAGGLVERFDSPA